MNWKEDIKEVVATEVKFLLFRPVRPDMTRLGNYYFTLGIATAWLAGVGRYWDNERAELWQYLGLGSVTYIFVLALILWLLIMPLRPKNWSYKGVVTFVGMTSPPAILYAIPVERFLTLSTASMINVLFLAIVATWRVGLLFQYLRRSARLSGFTIFVAAMLPITMIVATLTGLNLEHVVFRFMAGIMKEEKTANDAAYRILFLITFFSVMFSPVLLMAYLDIIYRKWRKGKMKIPG